MKKVLVCEVLQRMLKALDNEQLKLLEKTLNECLVAVDVVSAKEQEQQEMDYISLFVSAKRIEGRSEKTLTYKKRYPLFSALITCHIFSESVFPSSS